MTARPARRARAARDQQLYPAHDGAYGDRSFVVLPDAAALADKLALGRALRPLRRRIASPVDMQVDEVATAEQTAARRIAWPHAPLVPAFRPSRVRWLDAVLLVDRSQTMAVWRRSVEEWAVVLGRLGAFRNLRVWYLTSGADGAALAAPGDDPGQWIARDLAELIDPSGRQLVMIASDCIGPLWSNAAFVRWLARQAQVGPLAILQILPPHLWSRTALARLAVLSLTSSVPGLATQRLAAAALDPDEVDEAPSEALAPAIPVVPLRSDALAAWAQLIVGSARGRATGYRFTEAPAPVGARSAAAPDASSLVRRFLTGSSPTARKLAAYLAAVPLTAPVLRLVRQEVVPEAREEHLVEVLFSGLVVQRVPDLWTVAPGDELFDFRPGVREQLLSGLGTMTIEGVARAIGGYLERTRGAPYNFYAALDPSAAGPRANGSERLAFATVSAALLQVLQPARVDDPDAGARAASADAGDAPDQAAAASAPVDNGLWVMVDGLDHDPLPAHHRALARELGTQLAVRGFSLVTLNTQGIGRDVAETFWAVLRAQGFASGAYRVLRVLDESDVRGLGLEQAGRTWFPPGDDTVTRKAVEAADALLVIGESAASLHAARTARALAKPIVSPMGPLGEVTQDPIAPPSTWTEASTAAYARDLLTWLLTRIEHTESPASEAAILHEAALALDDPDLTRYQNRLPRFRDHRNSLTTSNPLIALQLLTDPRRPSHRLVGYGTAQTLSLGALLIALRLERRCVEQLRTTRTLHRGLEVLRSAFDAEQLDAAATRAVAVVCCKLHRDLDNTALERRDQCRSLIEGVFHHDELARAGVLATAAADYNALRRERPPGPARTRSMTRLVEDVRELGLAPSAQEAKAWFHEETEGDRIVALALTLGAPDPAAYAIVERAIGGPRSAFEQFTALCAAGAMLSLLDRSQRERLRDVLEAQRAGPPGWISVDDRSRWDLSGDLLQELREPANPPAAAPAPPSSDPGANGSPREPPSSAPASPDPALGAERSAPPPRPDAARSSPAYDQGSARAVVAYRRAVYADLGYLAAWPPDRAVVVGAVGSIIDGQFEQHATVADLGLRVEVIHTSMPAVHASAHARITTSASDPDHQLIELERPGAFFLATSPARCDRLATHHMAAKPASDRASARGRGRDSRAIREGFDSYEDLQSELVERVAYKAWNPSWVVITEVVRVDAAILVLAHGSHARVEIDRASTAEQAWSLGRDALSARAITLWQTRRAAAPLYSAAQLRRGFLGIGGYSLVKLRP